MSKTNAKSETGEFATFDAAKATEQFRSFAEKGAEQTKEFYDKMKLDAEDTRKAFEASFEQAKTVGDEAVLKSIAAMRTGAEANFAQFEALFGARSISEMIELQSAFMRKQMEFAVDQAKEFQAISQKAATEVPKPVKDVFEKTFRQPAA